MINVPVTKMKIKMCRMFGFDGSPQTAVFFQDALIKASLKDEFSANKISHDDGWGGVWHSDTDQRIFRTIIPIFKDERARHFLDSNSKAITTLVHARKASPEEAVRGPFDSHPFSTHAGEELVYVTHNGHISKLRKYSDLIGIDVNQLNDTEVFAYLLEKQEGSLEERLQCTIDLVSQNGVTQGALNLLILAVDKRGKRRIFSYCSFPDPKRELYYSLYLYHKNGESCVMSSTVAYHAGFVDLHGNPTGSEVTKCSIEKLSLL